MRESHRCVGDQRKQIETGQHFRGNMCSAS